MKDNKTKFSNPPSYIINQLRLFRFGKIFFNISITSIILIIVAFASSVLGPLLFALAFLILFLILLAIIIFTLGLVFLTPNNPVSKIWSLIQSLSNSSDAIMEITQFCFNITKWLSLIGIVASILGIVFIAITKRQNKVSKIVLLSILSVILIAVFVFQIVTGGLQWQG